MLAARFGAIALWPCHRARAEERLDLRHAELHRLADGEVHPVSGRHALDQGHTKRRLPLYWDVLEDVCRDAKTLDGCDAGAEFAAAAVEERDVFAGAQTHDVERVVRGIFREHARPAGTQR